MRKELRKTALLIWLIVLRLAWYPIDWIGYKFDQMADHLDQYADDIEEKAYGQEFEDR